MRMPIVEIIDPSRAFGVSKRFRVSDFVLSRKGKIQRAPIGPRSSMHLSQERFLAKGNRKSKVAVQTS